MTQGKYLVVIAGPTAIGKSKLSLQLADFFKTEIISADSRQFYKEISIGTAKPSPEELKAIRHHFINSISIHEPYSAGRFESEAILLLEQLYKKHNVVIMCGGSGLFIDAVCNGLDTFNEVDEASKEKVKAIFLERGIVGLQNEIFVCDPDYYMEVDKENPQRLMRALEVCYSTGKTYSGFRKNQLKMRNFKVVKILLNSSREKIYHNINLRVDQMIADGLINEAEKVYSYKHLNALNTVGYKELFAYFSGELSLDNAINLIKQHTRNYAKRQLTWFRNDANYSTFEPDDFEKIKQYILEIIEHESRSD